MQDKRSARSRSSLMAMDQLEEQQPAAASAASAHGLHHLLANADRLHKRASTQPSMSDDSSVPSRELRSGPSTSKYPVELLDVPSSAPYHVSRLAGHSGLIARNPAHEAALGRLTRQDSPSRKGPKVSDSESVASTQPVLVKEYSQDPSFSSSPKQSKMRSTKRSGGHRSSEMPPLESFSFQDILASIDSDVALSIDKIAEICGRSKMSMADEYSSHMPPQSDFSIPSMQDSGNEVAVGRLDPVEEASSTHEGVVDGSKSTRSRAARFSLASPVISPGELLSVPVTATSAVASHTQSSPVPNQVDVSQNREFPVNQLLAWLRTSRRNDSRSLQVSRRESGAANALQRILQSTGDPSTH
ncbi:MAG: hypothetical protein L6R36_005258 [Xanthoria steineri]|nr:MAG: hypothetical protein L6R36_005258 [Xanthoria steineri]